MLKVLVVEDDAQLATTLRYLVEDNPRYRVVATAEDSDAALIAAEAHAPHLALVDLHLAHGSTGFSVAVRLRDLNVHCLFISGNAPSFAMPDLALGCLMKPFTAEDVHRALALAEDRLRGRDPMRTRLPNNLRVYEAQADRPEPQPGFIPSRPSFRTRLEHWIRPPAVLIPHSVTSRAARLRSAALWQAAHTVDARRHVDLAVDLGAHRVCRMWMPRVDSNHD